jgi:hypothetical protein
MPVFAFFHRLAYGVEVLRDVARYEPMTLGLSAPELDRDVREEVSAKDFADFFFF